jgi:hypothetical protein
MIQTKLSKNLKIRLKKKEIKTLSRQKMINLDRKLRLSKIKNPMKHNQVIKRKMKLLRAKMMTKNQSRIKMKNLRRK